MATVGMGHGGPSAAALIGEENKKTTDSLFGGFLLLTDSESMVGGSRGVRPSSKGSGDRLGGDREKEGCWP